MNYSGYEFEQIEIKGIRRPAHRESGITIGRNGQYYLRFGSTITAKAGFNTDEPVSIFRRGNVFLIAKDADGMLHFTKDSGNRGGVRVNSKELWKMLYNAIGNAPIKYIIPEKGVVVFASEINEECNANG